MLMRASKEGVDAGERRRIVERFGQLPRTLQILDGFLMLAPIVIVATHQRRRQRKGIGLCLGIELGDRLLEVGEPARVADRNVGVAYPRLQRGACLARRYCGEGALIALDGTRNDS